MPLRWTVALLLALVLQLVGVYLPSSPPVPDGSPVPVDKVAHLLMFGLPAFAAPFALRRPAPVWALTAVHAPVSEWLQMAVLPNRSGDWHDAVADLVGLGIGAVAGATASGRARRADTMR